MTYDNCESIMLRDEISKLKYVIDEMKAEMYTPKTEVVDDDILESVYSAMRAADGYGLNISGADISAVDRQSIRAFFNNIKYIDKRVYDEFVKRLPAIVLGSLASKAQMKAQIEGEFPSPNCIAGPMLLNSYHLGIANHWKESCVFQKGENDYVHSGTDFLQGHPGKPIILGSNSVILLFGVMLQRKSAISSMKFFVNGKMKTPFIFDNLMDLANYKTKFFQKSFILRKDTQLLVQLYSERDTFLDEEDYPTLLGIAFIKEPATREMNPKLYPTFPGTIRPFGDDDEFEYEIHL